MPNITKVTVPKGEARKRVANLIQPDAQSQSLLSRAIKAIFGSDTLDLPTNAKGKGKSRTKLN